VNAEYSHIALRKGAAAVARDPDETYAEQFALCLLMPEDEVRWQRSGCDSIVVLAVYFGVPVEWMHRRLSDLGLLPEPAGV
jgi:Zn-dependent peptidase ImmA (M78 family)